MDTKPFCPSCGKPLAPDAPKGLCPECLMKGAFPTGTEPAPGGGSTFVPPPIGEIARLFPQLEILELLGHGGMGVVYKARQRQLGRLVALKILPPEAGRDPAFAERFTREARTLARLNHPNIVALYDFGRADNLCYVIMEYVDGLNLRQVECSRRLTPREALIIVPKICEALQYAHDQGVVHRDIKPENILVDKQGCVKIADFGLAKLLGRAPQDFRLTDTGRVMGTPHYMAPEQVEKPLEVDHRADIYSLGVVFYEMLTGELPLGKFALPSKKVQVDVRLDEVVLHALEKEPDRRYQQASQVKTDVETIAGTVPGAAAFAVGAGAVPPPAVPARKATSDKILLPTFLLAFFFGPFGAHRFYVGKYGTAILQLCTFGFCGFWVVIDWILILCKVFTDGEGRRITNWLHPDNGGPNPDVKTVAGTPPAPPPGVAPATPAGGNGRIVAPAVGLLVAAGLKLFASFVLLFTFTGPILNFLAFLGIDLSPAWRSLIGIGVVVFMIVPALLVLLGAVNMMRLRGYGWALAAAILAIVFPPAHLIGIPMGIWALVVLTRRDVREAFARRPAPVPPRFPLAWVALFFAGLSGVLGTAAFCIMPKTSAGLDAAILAAALLGILLGISTRRTWIGKTAMVIGGLNLVIALITSSLTGGTPNVTVTGAVTDAATGRPIAHARVSDNRYRADANKAPQEAWTDANGQFELKTWYEEHTIAASAPGYETGLNTLVTEMFGFEREMQMDFQLQPTDTNAPAQLSTLTSGPVIERARSENAYSASPVTRGELSQVITATGTLNPVSSDPEKWRIIAPVAEADIAVVEAGQNIVFTVDAFPSRRFTGSVLQISNAPTTIENTVAYETTLAVNDPDPKFRPGMTANVAITVAHRDAVLRIPNVALRFRPPGSTSANRERGSERTVYVLPGGNESTPEPVQIKTGITDGSLTEVTEGLKEGDRVVTGLASPQPAAQPAANANPGPATLSEPYTRQKSDFGDFHIFGDGFPILGDLFTQHEICQNFSQTLPLTANGRLSLDSVNGRIEINGWNRDEVVIKAVKHGKTKESVEALAIEVDASPDHVAIHTKQPSNWHGWKKDSVTVDYTIQVPQRARLEKIESVNGKTVIEGVSGDIEASAVNGEVQTRGAAGNLKLSTVNGLIKAELSSLGSGQTVSLSAVNGLIKATLPANADAEVTASTVNGSMSSEFSALVIKKEFPLGRHLNGTLGSGGASVKASAVNGGISFRRGGNGPGRDVNRSETVPSQTAQTADADPSPPAPAAEKVEPSPPPTPALTAAQNDPAVARYESGNEATFSHSFTVVPGGSLTVNVDRGSIHVAGSDQNQNTVEVRVKREVTRADESEAARILKEHHVVLRQNAGVISVTSEGPASFHSGSWWNWGLRPNLNVRYEITVPRKFDARLKTSGGAIEVANLQGSVTTKTEGGSLRFDGIEGSVDGKTEGGSIHADGCKDRLLLKTEGGSITIKEFSGPDVQATTEGGSVSADFVVQPRTNCLLHTEGGSVTARIPETAAVTLDAKTEGGTASTDLPVQIQGRRDRSVLRGTINGGGPLLKLETEGGSIRVLKR